MSIRRRLPACVLALVSLGGCASSHNHASMGQMSTEPPALSLGSGDFLGIQIYASDLALANQPTERNPVADVRYQFDEQR